MKYRVKHHDNTLIKFLFPVHFMGIEFDTYSVQCKQHWWSRWKICYNTDNIADAYNSLMKYQTNNKQSLPLGRYFTKLNQERYNIFSVVYELVLLIK